MNEDAVARALVASGGADVAFLHSAEEGVRWARGPLDAGGPFSAVTNLIQGLYELRGAGATRLLRNTIFTTRAPGPFELGLAKVAAKRLVHVHAVGDAEPIATPLVEVRYAYAPRPSLAVPRPDPEDHEGWLRAARELLARHAPPESIPRHARDRRVAAILVSPEGEVLGADVNANARNRTLHAELNVLAARWHATHERLAAGTRLYVTLEPCRACAALLWTLAEDPAHVTAYFVERDPGPAARNSILDATSNARRAFARTREQRAARTLVQLAI